jgi:lipid-binding SYLF domain-containing protein
MRHLIRNLALILAAVGASACAGPPVGSEPQRLVDRAALSVQDILSTSNDRLNAASLLPRARGAVVCPRSFRVAFFAGGEGGGCVLLGRDAAGSWSSPAFYVLGTGSFGLQAGIQDNQTLLLVMNDRALDALINRQFKFGADASVAVAHLGGSVEGATTTALGADIVAFSRSRGLFAGLSLDGTVLQPQPEWNQAYYGRAVVTRDIVRNMTVHNPGADPLRGALLRIAAVPRPSGLGPSPMAAPPANPGFGQPAAPPGGVDRAPLSPIAR